MNEEQMNEELKNKTVTFASITLMYSWTFKKEYPNSLAYGDALAAVKRTLTHDQLIELADKANAIVEQGIDVFMAAEQQR